MRITWRIMAVVLAAAALATALSTVLAVRYVSSVGDEPVVSRIVILNATFWYGWVLLAVPLFLLSHRHRIDRAPRVAVPIHIGALLVTAAAHVALQTTAGVLIAWRRIVAEQPEFPAGFSWPAEWLAVFQLELTRLFDWELMAGAAIVGIAHAFFYYRESQERALREAQLETNLVEARLQTLRQQLHPHFLFNTLHAVSALMHRDVEEANRMLVKLSDLLRLTLDSTTRTEMPLSEEVEFLEKYLQIEQVRLGDRLEVELDVAPETLDALVPVLILQPLVDNAIKHGIAPHGGPGRVTVSTRRDHDMLIMTIDDTGPGPSEHQLAVLSTGIGVANTRARLEHQFGSSFRFHLRRHAGGFTVIVAIPWRQVAADDSPAFVA